MIQTDLVKDFFKDLHFEEDSHSYYVNGKKLYTSVSGAIERNFKMHTDFNLIASRIDEREGLPPGTMRKLWDNKAVKAKAIGNKAHFFGEIYAFHRNIQPNDGYELGVVDFWDSLPDHIIPAFTELKMYHKVFMFGGMTDIVLYNTLTDRYIIADYKTNENIFKTFKSNRLLSPFDFYAESTFNEYQIQLSLYQLLFEQTGLEVEDRIVIWLKPDGSFEKFSTDELTDTLRRINI